MRKHIIISFFTLYTVHLTAQGVVQVSGTLPKSDLKAVQVAIDKVHLENSYEMHEAKVSKGHFEVAVNLERNRLGKLVYGENELQLYLEPGKTLEINFEKGKTNEAAFDGSLGANNAFLQDLDKTYGEKFDKEKMHKRIASKNIDELEMELYTERNEQMKHYTSSPHYSTLTDDFKKFIKNHIQYNYLAGLVAHPIIRGNADKKEMKVNNIPNVMLKDIKLRPVTNAPSLISLAYQEFLYYYVVYFTSEGNAFQKFTNHDESVGKKLEYSKRTVKGKPKIYVMGRLLAETGDKLSVEFLKNSVGTLNLQEQNTPGLNKTMPYTSLVQTKWAKELNRKPVVAKKDKTKDGKGSGSKNAPYELTNLDGKSVTLDDFKGKVVYIDFWASWCGPCRQQFPHAKAMKEKLTKKQKKEIVFLYISIDKNQGAWKKAIDKYDIKGYHVWSRGGWGSSATKHFGVTSIPRYMIMDKKGDIVDRNAKRPSMPETLQDLLDLL